MTWLWCSSRSRMAVVDDGVAEHRAPFSNVAIGADEHGALLVTAADEVEEEISSVGFERQVTELVD